MRVRSSQTSPCTPQDRLDAYESDEAFIADVHLVFENAMKYHSEGRGFANVASTAAQLKQEFRHIARALHSDAGDDDGDDDAEPPPAPSNPVVKRWQLGQRTGREAWNYALEHIKSIPESALFWAPIDPVSARCLLSSTQH